MFNVISLSIAFVQRLYLKKATLSLYRRHSVSQLQVWCPVFRDSTECRSSGSVKTKQKSRSEPKGDLENHPLHP